MALQHPGVWRGPDGAFESLLPDGFKQGTIRAMASYQAGGVSPEQPNTPGHAAIWFGSRDSFVDLGAPYGDSTIIEGCCDVEQVGTIWLKRAWLRACLWRGTPESMTVLHIPSFRQSWAYDTNGVTQVGEASISGGYLRAIAWFGSANKYVVLHKFLPSSVFASGANAVDEEGNIGGWVVLQPNQGKVPVIWVPVPSANGRKK